MVENDKKLFEKVARAVDGGEMLDEVEMMLRNPTFARLYLTILQQREKGVTSLTRKEIQFLTMETYQNCVNHIVALRAAKIYSYTPMKKITFKINIYPLEQWERKHIETALNTVGEK